MNKRKKEEVSRGLPRPTPLFFSILGIDGRTPRQRSQNFVEETVWPACHEMGETLLRGLRIL
jgi:hypothetical protein